MAVSLLTEAISSQSGYFLILAGVHGAAGAIHPEGMNALNTNAEDWLGQTRKIHISRPQSKLASWKLLQSMLKHPCSQRYRAWPCSCQVLIALARAGL